jgi:hypothetical protein
MKKEERINRIIARGEVSNHSHVIVGDATITRNESGEILIEVGNEGAILKHILESEWLKGKEVWTGEHKDIPLEKGKYQYVPQIEYDPYQDLIRQVQD